MTYAKHGSGLNRGSYVYILDLLCFTLSLSLIVHVSNRELLLSWGSVSGSRTAYKYHKPTTSFFHSPPSRRLCLFCTLLDRINGRHYRTFFDLSPLSPSSKSRNPTFVFTVFLLRFFLPPGKFLCVGLILVYLLVGFSTSKNFVDIIIELSIYVILLFIGLMPRIL